MKVRKLIDLKFGLNNLKTSVPVPNVNVKINRFGLELRTLVGCGDPYSCLTSTPRQLPVGAGVEFHHVPTDYLTVGSPNGNSDCCIIPGHSTALNPLIAGSNLLYFSASRAKNWHCRTLEISLPTTFLLKTPGPFNTNCRGRPALRHRQQAKPR